MKELLTKYGWIVLVGGIIAGILTYYNLPKKVKENTVAIEAVDKGVNKVAHTFDLYMMEQRTIQVEENKREKLMLELIKDK